jgi:hypothetical protein
MEHNVRIPAHLSDPGVTDWQAWGFVLASVLVGCVVGCIGDAYAGLIAAWLTQVVLVVALCVHRHRRVRAAYHAQRRHGR